MTASSSTAAAAKPLSKRVTPPFRADHVGSLLRPKHLLEARDRLDKGEITAAELHRIEDEAVRHAIKRQEEAGLKSITDGEFRRRSWHMDFICRIGGVVSAGTQVRPFHNEKGDVKNEIEAPGSRAAPARTTDLRRRFSIPQINNQSHTQVFYPLAQLVAWLGLDPGGQKRLRQSRRFLARSRQGLHR